MEDKEIICAQQRILDLDADAPMLAMRMDTALASIHALMDKAIQSEQAMAVESTVSRHYYRPRGGPPGIVISHCAG